MRFINVSEEDIEAVRDSVRRTVFSRAKTGYFEDCWSGVTVTFEKDSFEVSGGCCWDCDTSTYARIAIEELDWTSEQKENFWDVIDQVNENDKYLKFITWDCSTSTFTNKKD